VVVERLGLEPVPQSARAARRYVRSALTGLGATEAATTAAELLISEVVTNAVLHARSAIDVSVATVGDQVEVAVLDGSPAPLLPRSFGVQGTTGRGLRLLASLASSWGVEPRADAPGLVPAAAGARGRPPGRPARRLVTRRQRVQSLVSLFWSMIV
jgi:anti-sigma regulatory factor (Ser/Thr protein kinase)